MWVVFKTGLDPQVHGDFDAIRALHTETKDRTEEIWYVCRHCGNKITQPRHILLVNQTYRHSFANPSGIVYEILSFVNAMGCKMIGAPSYEFTWFPGHSWCITLCSGCWVHLGWFFSDQDGKGFFGLITEKIVLKAMTEG